jgi:hypothetical protein
MRLLLFRVDPTIFGTASPSNKNWLQLAVNTLSCLSILGMWASFGLFLDGTIVTRDRFASATNSFFVLCVCVYLSDDGCGCGYIWDEYERLYYIMSVFMGVYIIL